MSASLERRLDALELQLGVREKTPEQLKRERRWREIWMSLDQSDRDIILEWKRLDEAERALAHTHPSARLSRIQERMVALWPRYCEAIDRLIEAQGVQTQL